MSAPSRRFYLINNFACLIILAENIKAMIWTKFKDSLLNTLSPLICIQGNPNFKHYLNITL